MSYSTASNGNTTLIEHLPTIDDIENSSSPSGMQGVEEKYQKFLRNRHDIPKEAGMVSQNITQSDPRTASQHFNPNYLPNPMAQSYEGYESPEPNMENNMAQMYQSINDKYNLPHNSPTCLEVADHVNNCPICSQFYKSNSSPYTITIIVLAVICILLLKKILDTN
tara:strand:- start:333 stop:830 length:498 start_codon:yes stop_codon:yes gene_type:complete